ncbi:UDP-N-acetylglucosamine 2-epimerase (hydrolyzing) [Bowmanella sp. Y57]|uniref:UDP-N-acetylglucosamine 2-epimerase (Hydrolyzing) n=2 Tax=Bowmanella yangjiangensis TaxID=2811230 RepID=A0ABS3CQZ4_9ALTE|nr:UDP-N-acetylglucosamine 2-epimerase (hydrolyzing) [Bowmanella yangjiangensis]
MMRRIAVFTGTRAEYGLLQWVIRGLHEHHEAQLQLIVGGMHLSPEFGYTAALIEQDGFPITEKIEFLLSSDTPVGIAKSMGLATISGAEAFERHKPDLLVLLGDRFEALAMAQAAMVARIPIAHIHGGERTEGLIDEAIRHSITKMSHLHFTSTEEYRTRVIQLGEHPERVFHVGAPGLDSIRRLNPIPLKVLSKIVGINLTDSPYFVVTYHPETLSPDGAIEQFRALLSVLSATQSHKLVITYPNADTHGRSLIALLNEFKHKNKDTVAVVKSVGQQNYLSLLKYCDAVIGNSSSGILEAPSFHVPTINIGSRQRGRITDDTVIHCDEDEDSIHAAVRKALSKDFKEKCTTSKSVYGDGLASERILETLMNTELKEIIRKHFYDLPGST